VDRSKGVLLPTKYAFTHTSGPAADLKAGRNTMDLDLQ
jgi:hypothetical protein